MAEQRIVYPRTGVRFTVRAPLQNKTLDATAYACHCEARGLYSNISKDRGLHTLHSPGSQTRSTGPSTNLLSSEKRLASSAQDTAWLDEPGTQSPRLLPMTSVTRLAGYTPRKRRTTKQMAEAAALAAATAPGSVVEAIDWLDAEDNVVSIETPAKMTRDKARFKSMARGAVMGRDRIWACDGEYVAVRLNSANPHTQQRHQKFLESGHYKHVETQDDVQVFKLLDGSPFKRKYQFHTGELKDNDVFLLASKTAVTRDWPAYADILEEMAARIKSRLDAGNAKLAWDEWLERLFENIRMRGGPTQAEVDAGFQRVRMQRGTSKGKLIVLGKR